MLAIISPAKTLDFKSPLATEKFTLPDFAKESQELIKTLRSYDPAAISNLMGISDKLAALNHERYRQWDVGASADKARPAILAFKGDVYVGLDAPTMQARDFTWAQKHLRVLSGLHGLLKPLDRIQPYRLEMGTRLPTSKGANLYEFWDNKVTDAVNQGLAEQQHKVLINLASNEYYKSINTNKIDGRIITINFKEWRREAYRFVSFSAKKARGLMSRYMINERITAPNNLKYFDWEGYGFNQKLSSDDEWIFTRKHT
tara:strand:- start:62 stop:835 length:774 start_codon:yes stop_codon:yes gene_type:complete